MIAIIGKDVKVYALPLGDKHKAGYGALVVRVCQVECQKKRWTGFGITPEHILTAGFFPHGKDFDIEFYKKKQTVGFLTQDDGDILELGVAYMPRFDGLYSQYSHVMPGQTLFVIGSILGIPFTLASCTVERILVTPQIITQERLLLLDEHSAGSPVFNIEGSLVGILEAYIEKTDRMVIRSLTANHKGLLTA